MRGALQRIEAHIGGDAVQPGPEQRATLEVRAAAPSPQQRFLEQVLGVVERAEHSVQVHVELSPITLGECSECRLVAGSHAARTAASSAVWAVAVVGGVMKVSRVRAASAASSAAPAAESSDRGEVTDA